MKKGFEEFLNGYNQAQMEEFKEATKQMAISLFAYYQAMLEAGFTELQALELTKQFQSHMLTLSARQSKSGSRRRKADGQ